MFVFGTKEGWIERSNLSGDLNPTSINPNTSAVYTTAEGDQAFYRGQTYIIETWWNFVKPQYKSDTLEGVDPEVAQAFTTATYYASSHEIETPRIYSVTINPQRDREVKKVGIYEFFQTRSNKSTTERVQNERPINDSIHRLLDRYVDMPSQTQAPVDEEPFYFGVVSTSSGCK